MDGGQPTTTHGGQGDGGRALHPATLWSQPKARSCRGHHSHGHAEEPTPTQHQTSTAVVGHAKACHTHAAGHSSLTRRQPRSCSPPPLPSALTSLPIMARIMTREHRRAGSPPPCAQTTRPTPRTRRRLPPCRRGGRPATPPSAPPFASGQAPSNTSSQVRSGAMPLVNPPTPVSPVPNN